SATLNGSVDPHGLTTSVYFEYGTTTSYGFTTTPQSKTRCEYHTVDAKTTYLSACTIYHVRIVASNSAGGPIYGSDTTFTTLSATGAPIFTLSLHDALPIFSATLNGSVDPHGLTTSVYFEYGTTTSYGFTTTPQSKT